MKQNIRALNILTHLSLIVTPHNRLYDYLHFTDKKTEL